MRIERGNNLGGSKAGKLRTAFAMLCRPHLLPPTYLSHTRARRAINHLRLPLAFLLGATMGLSLKRMTSDSTLAANMFASRGRFFALIML